MSSDQSAVSNGESGQTSTQVESEEYVPVKAYKEVASDMHKFKSKVREEQARAAELEARLKAIEEDKMAEQQRFKELWEKERQEKEAAIKRASEKEQAWLLSVKKSALKSELGADIKDAYLVHADLSKIEFNEDGSLNMDSVRISANKFREEHSSLIPSKARIDAASKASPVGQTVSTGEKSLESLTGDEAYALLTSMTNSKGTAFGKY